MPPASDSESPETSRTYVRVVVASGHSKEVGKTFFPGQRVESFTLGTAGDWPIDAPGVATVHAELAFDGVSLMVAPIHPTKIGSTAAPAGWSIVPVPSEIAFGGARLSITRAASTSRPPSPLPSKGVDSAAAWAARAAAFESDAPTVSRDVTMGAHSPRTSSRPPPLPPVSSAKNVSRTPSDRPSPVGPSPSSPVDPVASWDVTRSDGRPALLAMRAASGSAPPSVIVDPAKSFEDTPVTMGRPNVEEDALGAVLKKGLRSPDGRPTGPYVDPAQPTPVMVAPKAAGAAPSAGLQPSTASSNVSMVPPKKVLGKDAPLRIAIGVAALVAAALVFRNELGSSASVAPSSAKRASSSDGDMATGNSQAANRKRQTDQADDDWETVDSDPASKAGQPMGAAAPQPASTGALPEASDHGRKLQTATATNDSPSVTQERRAVDLVARGALVEAVRVYEGLVKEHPDNPALAEALRFLRKRIDEQSDTY